MVTNAETICIIVAAFVVGQVVNGQHWPQRGPAEAAVPFRAHQLQSCDLGKVNRRWPTAGLPENRAQTRSNSLLLWAAKETECSQSVHESTVDFSPWNLNRQQERNTYCFPLFFSNHSQNNTAEVLRGHFSIINVMRSSSSWLVIHLLSAVRATSQWERCRFNFHKRLSCLLHHWNFLGFEVENPSRSTPAFVRRIGLHKGAVKHQQRRI